MPAPVEGMRALKVRRQKEEGWMYGIGTASLLSGVRDETIRMWERRYRIPSPVRSEGGHRKYTDRDIALLRAVKRLVDGGARVGAVAEMSEPEILAAAAALDQGGAGGGFADTIERVIAAARLRDTRRAEELLDPPLFQRHALEVIRDLYLPLLARVGELWSAGELDIAAEHFIEKLVSGRLHAVLANLRTEPGGPRAVCACPPGERHEVALLAASVALKEAGFAVVNLGADVPVADLVATLRVGSPSLLVLAATLQPSATVAQELAAGLAPFARLPIVLGGAGAGALQDRLGRRAVVCGDLAQLGALARGLLAPS